MIRSRCHNLFLQTRLAHDARDQRNSLSALGDYLMMKAALTGPLRHAAGEIDVVAGDLPIFITQLDDDADGTRADDAPFPFADIRHSRGLTVDQRADGADTERIADAIDVAAQR